MTDHGADRFIGTEPRITQLSRAGDSASMTGRPLRTGSAVDEHDVGGEVVVAPDQRRADAVGVDRHARGLELADPLGVEAAAGDDPHVGEAGGVERRADLLDQARD